MIKFFKYLFYLIKSKKRRVIKKKKIVIFDRKNSDILLKILPKNNSYVLDARVNLLKEIFLNYDIILFLIKNFFLRSITLNYFIIVIKKIQPRVVLTFIDNSLAFSILTKYFEKINKKIKFIAIQNGNRGDIYLNNTKKNKLYYFTNYIGFSYFDYKLLKKKKIKVQKFYSMGSLKSSYFKNFIKKKNKKIYNICFINQRIIKNNINNFHNHLSSIKCLEFLARYVKETNKSIIIQSKQHFNNEEKKFYDRLFKNTKYKISWQTKKKKFNTYKNLYHSDLIIAAFSTVLREAYAYSNKKIAVFNLEEGINKYHPPHINVASNSYQGFKQKINSLFALKYNNFLKKLPCEKNYYMENNNTFKFLRRLIKKEIN